MTFITILIPCLIAILLFYVYRDITGKVSLTKDIGSRELQDFSDNQDAKFKALDDRFKNLKITLNERLVGIEKSIDGLQKNIRKSEQHIKDIEKNEPADVLQNGNPVAKRQGVKVVLEVDEIKKKDKKKYR